MPKCRTTSVSRAMDRFHADLGNHWCVRGERDFLGRIDNVLPKHGALGMDAATRIDCSFADGAERP